MSLTFVGCHEQTTAPDQIVGSGRLVSEQRTVAAFTGIQVTGIGKVFVKQDTVQSLRIEADDNIVDDITTSVGNGLLVVGLRQGSYSKITINVYVSMRSIDRLESIGTADFSTVNPIQANAILCRITGVGTITLTGTAVNETIELTGTGDVQNFDLIASRCTATVSGVGTIQVNVTQQLDAVIAGVGSIIYAGNPPAVNRTILGVGSVRPRS
jgi:hypothetical protein